MPIQIVCWICGLEKVLKMFFRKKKKPPPHIEHINADFHPAENIKPPTISKGLEIEDLKYHMIIQQHLLDLGSKETDSLWEELDKHLTKLKEYELTGRKTSS